MKWNDPEIGNPKMAFIPMQHPDSEIHSPPIAPASLFGGSPKMAQRCSFSFLFKTQPIKRATPKKRAIPCRALFNLLPLDDSTRLEPSRAYDISSAHQRRHRLEDRGGPAVGGWGKTQWVCLGVAQNQGARVTRILVSGSIYRGHFSTGFLSHSHLSLFFGVGTPFGLGVKGNRSENRSAQNGASNLKKTHTQMARIPNGSAPLSLADLNHQKGGNSTKTIKDEPNGDCWGSDHIRPIRSEGQKVCWLKGSLCLDE